MMDKVSERRHLANKFFLAVNTGFVAVLTALIGLTQQPVTQYRWIVIATIVGIIICITWRRLILSYKQLNAGKFVIIHLLETRLPARLFDAEWDALNHGDGTLYTPFANLEMWVPIMFAVMYVIIGLLTFF